jgi:hypothetical protein
MYLCNSDLPHGNSGTGWNEPSCPLVPWRHEFRHPTRNECMGCRALHSVPMPTPMPMGFGWAWVQCYCSWVGMGFVHPCIQLQIGVKLLGCREYANQETLRVEANDSERPFICPIQPRLGVGG